MAEKKIKVTQTRSQIGHIGRQKETLKCLGLGKIGNTKIHVETPSTCGMIKAVSHLVRIERLGEKTNGE